MKIEADVDNSISITWLISGILTVFSIAWLWIRSIGSDVSKNKTDNDLTITKIANQFTQEYLNLRHDIDIIKLHQEAIILRLSGLEEADKESKKNQNHVMITLDRVCQKLNIEPHE